MGGTFLTSFLNKCRSRSEEVDFRPLFENFVHDLLTTVNKPEWPATELLLSLLGTMLVSTINNKWIYLLSLCHLADYLVRPCTPSAIAVSFSHTKILRLVKVTDKDELSVIICNQLYIIISNIAFFTR